MSDVAAGSRWKILREADDPRKCVCQCTCGREKEVWKIHVKYGNSMSCGTCGFLRNGKKRGLKHGMCGTPEYGTWIAMRHRCSNPADSAYYNYGARGITVCARWNDKRDGFANFYEDMGPVQGERHTLDRIDGTRGYWCGKHHCPECGPAWREPNCRWASRKEQARNIRTIRPYTHNGMTKTYGEWCDWVKETRGIVISRGILCTRLNNGWDFERAITEPVHRNILDPEAVRYILRNHKKYDLKNGALALAERFGCSIQTIDRLLAGEIHRYRYLYDEYQAELNKQQTGGAE